MAIQQAKANGTETSQRSATTIDAVLPEFDTLISHMIETEQLVQHMIHAEADNVLLRHTALLYRRYLQNLLDMQDVLQRLQQGSNQEASLGGQLITLLNTLQSPAPEESLGEHHPEPISALAGHIQQSLQQGGKIQSVLKIPCKASANPPPTETLGQNVQTRHLAAKAITLHIPKLMTPITVHDVPQQAGLRLDVYLFGEFRASLNGKPIKRWPHGKGQQIFKYLLLHRSTPVRKERLMETFWPDIDIRAARNNLNVSIYYLRQDLSRYHKRFQFVLYQDDCYLLNPELSLWADAEAFDKAIRQAHRHLAKHETALATAAYRDAEALYKGDCLQGETTDWATLTTQAYRTRYLEIISHLGEQLFADGDYQGCAEWWQKAIAFDNCDERAHRHIMQCYLKAGHRQLALRQYHLCVESLHKELGLEPSAKTQEVLAQIRQAEA